MILQAQSLRKRGDIKKIALICPCSAFRTQVGHRVRSEKCTKFLHHADNHSHDLFEISSR